MSTGLVYDDGFLLHNTGAGHPERPARLRAIMARLRGSDLWPRLTPIAARPATLEQIRLCHSDDYVTRLRAACAAGKPMIDTVDCPICPATYDTALLAAGGVLAAADAILAGQVTRAFCAVRPPGHHAEQQHAMGFCFFANVAIAAVYALSRGLDRVAVVDFDVHHGNGTQHLLEARGDVLFISLHEHPEYLYPGTGYAEETGVGEGMGNVINLPIVPPAGDEEYLQLFDDRVLPAIDAFAPEMLLISAGFDASAADPLAHMRVTPAGFAAMTRRLREAADRHCGGRLLSSLEGGYDLDSLAECAEAHVRELLD